MARIHTMASLCVFIGLFLESVLFAQVSSSVSPGPVITTKVGSFQGLHVTPPGLSTRVNAFLGIPYGKPPTGEQRFNKPIPFGSFPGIYSATTKPPCCFQLESDLHLIWADKNSTMSEDCLYMNIWTPESTATEENLKPVMVWIHGGGFTVGSSALDLYDGQVLSALGDVVVVTINYGLGPFGFFDTLTDDIPGNAGLHDQLLALKWVQTNIVYFGGDPKRVTLSGESAGAMSSGFFSLSPLSHGLFQRLIIQSGSPYSPPGRNPRSSVENGNLLATFVGCANDTSTLSTNPKEVLSCLRNVPPAELTKTYYKQHGSHQEKIVMFYVPQFWDEIIPRHPIDIFLSKNYSTYDMFSGVCQTEGSSLFAYFFPDQYEQYTEGTLVINKTLAAAMVSGLMEAYGFPHPQKAVDYYFKDIEDDEETILNAVYDAIGDSIITCPTIFYAERYSAKDTPVFFFRFDHRPSSSPWPNSVGATHFDEVQFVFGLPVRYPERYQGEEKALSEYMIRIWTSFAKSEDLTLKNGSKWPNYSRSKPVFATFQTGQQDTGSGIRKEACEFWRPYFQAE